MREAVPPGQPKLGGADLAELRRMTRQLVATGDGQELRRFLAVADRGIAVPHHQLDTWLGGRTVLVTGGTGCIGAALMARLTRYCPARLVSVSRGVTTDWPRLPDAEYVTADITDPHALGAVFDQVRPEVVFHLAAQRDPGLAEHEVHRTVNTNVFGTRNVAEAAERSGVTDLVCASSGKAVRPYSGEVYTASKRTLEWLLAAAAAESPVRYSAVRFTHVMDNSIIYQRLMHGGESGVVRLHEADVAFYVQSARESAELLLCAGLASRAGALRVLALTDLGWPVSLLGLALGVFAETGCDAAVYFSGHDAGYERTAFPGLYDPLTAGQVSPLLSAFEAVDLEPGPCPMVDVCPVAPMVCPGADDLLGALAAASQPYTDPDEVRAALSDLSWCLFDGAMSVTPRHVLARAIKLTQPHLPSLSAEHRRMLDVITRYAETRELTTSAAHSAG